MKPLKQLCSPRPSVFDTQRRDTVLDITDLIGDRINPEEFFHENYITDGMKTLGDYPLTVSSKFGIIQSS